MFLLRSKLICLAIAVCGPCLPASALTEPDAAAIMARVAANQDAAQDERAHYVYVQHAKVVSRKGKTVMCEEITDSRVTPSASGSQTTLMKLDGRMLVKHQYVSYTAPHIPQPANATEMNAERDSVSINVGDDNTDRDMVEHMRLNLLESNAKDSDTKAEVTSHAGADSPDSKDGVDNRLFPLTSKSQADYLFQLVGRERMNNRAVFHIAFRPKSKQDFSWKGDAYIDSASYQPVVIVTDLSRKIPLAVRALLGTNVPGLGFTVTYAPQPDGVWFPTSLSTEFKIHVLFFFKREIIIDARNHNFEKTHVTSKILSTGEPEPQPEQK